jgi:hypothetical protein
MNMKEHILAAMQEQLGQCDQLLAGLSAEQWVAPQFDEGWSIQDVVIHLWGWQQISLARMLAGAQNREPLYPDWLTSFPGNWDENAGQTNAWMVRQFHSRAWAQVYSDWRAGYQQLLAAAAQVPERLLIDLGYYAWLDGYSLALILLASYDHHQEHLEKLQAWLQEQHG